MKKIVIYYFSGTGNTYYVIKQIASELSKLGNQVSVVSCEDEGLEKHSYDMLGIAFPIHTSMAPQIMKEHLESLPIGDNIPLFGIVTSGYYAGDVLIYYDKLFQSQGYVPFLYQNFVVGNNLHLPYLSPLRVLVDNKLESTRTKIKQKAAKVAVDINQVNRNVRGNDPVSRIFGISQRSLGKVHERVNFKGFYSDNKCTKCNWCVRNCPTNNILIESDNIEFGDDCTLCMRCYNFCPSRAIQSTRHSMKSKYKRYSGIEHKHNRSNFK